MRRFMALIIVLLLLAALLAPRLEADVRPAWPGRVAVGWPEPVALAGSEGPDPAVR